MIWQDLSSRGYHSRCPVTTMDRPVSVCFSPPPTIDQECGENKGRWNQGSDSHWTPCGRTGLGTSSCFRWHVRFLVSCHSIWISYHIACQPRAHFTTQIWRPSGWQTGSWVADPWGCWIFNGCYLHSTHLYQTSVRQDLWLQIEGLCSLVCWPRFQWH